MPFGKVAGKVAAKPAPVAPPPASKFPVWVVPVAIGAVVLVGWMTIFFVSGRKRGS